jgi:hypothetical protein
MKLGKKLAVAASGVALATAVWSAADAGASTAGTSAAPKPGTWHRVTATGLENINEIGLVRGADGVLHVLWTAGATTGNYSVLDTPIAANGTASRTVVIASHFDSAAYPDGTATPGGVDAFWNGIQSGNPGTPEGTYEATRPLRGGAWHVSPSVTPAANQYWYENLSAATGADGKPWVTFTTGGGIAVKHFGHPEYLLNIRSCCQYYQGIGTDGKSGQTWLTYFSNATGQTGTYYQPFTASGRPAGGAKRAPGSATGGNARETSERVTAVGRGHGRPGVYITYLSGYPFARAVDLYRLGAKSAMAVVGLPALNNIGLSTLAADPQGRIWVTWASTIDGQAALYVRRSNAAVTAFSSTANVRLPAGTTNIWRVYVSAQSGRLDVLALLTVHGAIAYWTTQVLPPK